MRFRLGAQRPAEFCSPTFEILFTDLSAHEVLVYQEPGPFPKSRPRKREKWHDSLL